MNLTAVLPTEPKHSEQFIVQMLHKLTVRKPEVKGHNWSWELYLKSHYIECVIWRE